MLLAEIKGMHFIDFGQNELTKSTAKKIGLKEVYREDNQYVTYVEAINEDFIVYYFPQAHRFLFVYDKIGNPNVNEVLNLVSEGDAAYTENQDTPSILIMQDVFPPKMVGIDIPEGVVESSSAFSLDMPNNLVKPINRFLTDITFDLMLYQHSLGKIEILKQYLFEKDGDYYTRIFADGTKAFVAFNDKAVGITATGVRLDELERHLVRSAENSQVAPMFPMSSEKYQVINIMNEKRYTLSITEDVRGEGLDLNMPISGFRGIRVFSNN